MPNSVNNSFVHLNVHSDYSLTYSIARIEDLVSYAAQIGQDTLALTDFGNLFGVIEFSKACKNNGIHAIIGSTMWVTSNHKQKKDHRDIHALIFLCKNKKGFFNLKQLSTIGYIEGYWYQPRIDIELIKEYSEGLICIIPQHDGIVGMCYDLGKNDQAVKEAAVFKDIFKDDLYIELQNHGQIIEAQVNAKLFDCAQSLGIECVVGNDCFYVRQTDAFAHEIFLKNNIRIKRDFAGEEYYLKSVQEMQLFFKDYPQALENTRVIANKCNFEIEFPGPQFPDFAIPKEFDGYASYLRHLVFEGLKNRYKHITQDILDRAEYELKTIIDMGFSGYFLITWDIVVFAERKNIPVGLGRGSAAGSIVAYALGITGLDPLKYGLLFERFLNPERISMPDIDTDFCVNGRQEVISYIKEKYGKDHVGQIITFSALKPRGAVRDVARASGIKLEIADEIAKLIPANSQTIQEAVELEPRLSAFIQSYPQLFEVTDKILGVHRHASLHAAGVVIGKKPLIEYLPLYKDTKSGSIATQYTMDYLEDCGLVKMDILGLRALTVIDCAQNIIRETEPDFDINNIPECDKKTFEMLSAGQSDVVFQFESDGMRRALRMVQPSRVEDLIALNALYRPGPMDNIQTYADVKHGRKSPNYHLPELKSVLEETYGVVVYQEQVMEIARVVAGYSLGGADILRRVMGKKKVEEMEEQYAIFVDGAIKQGFDKKTASEIFEFLKPFAGYGFNKSHAAAYGVLAYRTAYLKRHYPKIFLVSQINACASNLIDVAKYIQVCRSMNIKILTPDVNYSEYLFSIEKNYIRYGLNAIKTISDDFKKHIPEERKKNGAYSSVIDVIERLPTTNALDRFLEAAISSGLFDSIDNNRPLLFANKDYFVDLGGERQSAYSCGRTLLFTEEEDVANNKNVYPCKEGDESALMLEREFLGSFFTFHPIQRAKDVWEKETTLNLSTLKWQDASRDYVSRKNINHYLVCYIDDVHIILKEEYKMYIGIAEDLCGSIKFVYKIKPSEEHTIITKRFVCALVGTLRFSEEDGHTLWVSSVQTLESVHEVRRNDFKAASLVGRKVAAEFHIQFLKSPDKDRLKKMQEFFSKYYGETRVVVHMPATEDNKAFKIVLPHGFTVNADDKEFISALENHPMIEKIWCE